MAGRTPKSERDGIYHTEIQPIKYDFVLCLPNLIISLITLSTKVIEEEKLGLSLSDRNALLINVSNIFCF